MLKIFCLFVPLIHLCTTTFHPVHNFHPPAELSAATHSQIGLKKKKMVAKRSLSLVHLTQQISYRFIISSECQLVLIFTGYGAQIVMNNSGEHECQQKHLLKSISWENFQSRLNWTRNNQATKWKSRTFIPFLALICSSVYLLFLFPVSSSDPFLKVEHLLASCLVAFAATYWPLGLDDDSCSTHWNLATAILREWMD